MDDEEDDSGEGKPAEALPGIRRCTACCMGSNGPSVFFDAIATASTTSRILWNGNQIKLNGAWKPVVWSCSWRQSLKYTVGSQALLTRYIEPKIQLLKWPMFLCDPYYSYVLLLLLNYYYD